MKRFFCSLLILLNFPLLTPAQVAVTGYVREMSGPLEFANVIAYQWSDTTKPYKAGVSDSAGKFRLDVPANDYLLKVKLLGYKEYISQLAIKDSESIINLDPIELIPDGKLLDGIEVSAQRDLIKKTPQGFIIQAKDNLTQATGTATDLLKNTPTVVVDADGNITVRGKSPLILINGRNSVLSATDKIPASSVESIEIINNPGAQYDADADGGIIIIRLKKNTAGGTNGSAALGAGYGAKPRVNSAFIINHQGGKWNVGLAYDNRFAERTRKADATRLSYQIPSEYYLLQNRHDNRLEGTQNVKFNIDYSGTRNEFGFEAIGNLGSEDNLETLVSEFRDNNNLFQNKNSRFSSEHVREKAMEYAFSYNRKFADARKKFGINLSSSFNFDTENTDITTRSLTSSDAQIGDPFLQRTHNYQNSNVSNLRVDYAYPLSQLLTLETGYKGIYRHTDADFLNEYVLNNEYLVNAGASNIFHFSEQVHAAYLQVKGFTGKPDSSRLKYDAGLRVEQMMNEGYNETNTVHVQRQYFNIFPSANVIFNVNSSDFLKFSYSRRINRPGLGQLNPFADVTDSLSQHSGNPYLKPEYINSAEAGYNKEWKKISFSAITFYRYASNIIRPYITVQPSGVALTKPMNFGTGITYGFEGILSAFPVSRWNFNASFSVYQQQINGSNVSADLANNLLSYYGKLINNITLWRGSRLQLIANYNSPIATPQGSRIAVYFMDLGFQQKIGKGRGALGLVITDVFNTQRSGLTASGPDFSYSRTFKVDTRAVLVTFAWTFKSKLRDELLENKFSND